MKGFDREDVKSYCKSPKVRNVSVTLDKWTTEEDFRKKLGDDLLKILRKDGLTVNWSYVPSDDEYKKLTVFRKKSKNNEKNEKK